MIELELVAQSRQQDIEREIQNRCGARSAALPSISARRIVRQASRGLIRTGLWLERLLGEAQAFRPEDPGARWTESV